MEEQGIEPPTLWLVDYSFYLLSPSHIENKISVEGRKWRNVTVTSRVKMTGQGLVSWQSYGTSMATLALAHYLLVVASYLLDRYESSIFSSMSYSLNQSYIKRFPISLCILR